VPDLLGRVPYFRVLSARKRGALARRFRSVAFARHQSVFVEGEPCDGLWIVAEGRLKVFRTSSRGREHLLHVRGLEVAAGEGD
jgi:CRP-like cAMP-binding protein